MDNLADLAAKVWFMGSGQRLAPFGRFRHVEREVQQRVWHIGTPALDNGCADTDFAATCTHPSGQSTLS
jgi:hypothetical protein